MMMLQLMMKAKSVTNFTMPMISHVCDNQNQPALDNCFNSLDPLTVLTVCGYIDGFVDASKLHLVLNT